MLLVYIYIFYVYASWILDFHGAFQTIPQTILKRYTKRYLQHTLATPSIPHFRSARHPPLRTSMTSLLLSLLALACAGGQLCRCLCWRCWRWCCYPCCCCCCCCCCLELVPLLLLLLLVLLLAAAEVVVVVFQLHCKAVAAKAAPALPALMKRATRNR